MIAVLDFCDGFGNDTVVCGIYDSIDKAKKDFSDDCFVRFTEFDINKRLIFGCLDWWSAEPLYKEMCK